MPFGKRYFRCTRKQLFNIQGDYSFSLEKARKLIGHEPVMNAAQAEGELLQGYMEDPQEAKKSALMLMRSPF